MARLGYARYGAAGCDWGTSISTLVGQRDREHVAGIHVFPPLAPPDPATFDDLTERERAALASLEHSAEWDSGYSREHATRRQTIGYALADSPAALCAWIVEKFWAWTDCDGHPEKVLTRDELLDKLPLRMNIARSPRLTGPFRYASGCRRPRSRPGTTVSDAALVLLAGFGSAVAEVTEAALGTVPGRPFRGAMP
jgi:hypothetical protein